MLLGRTPQESIVRRLPFYQGQLKAKDRPKSN
jgi:hypothetical protein